MKVFFFSALLYIVWLLVLPRPWLHVLLYCHAMALFSYKYYASILSRCVSIGSEKDPGTSGSLGFTYTSSVGILSFFFQDSLVGWVYCLGACKWKLNGQQFSSWNQKAGAVQGFLFSLGSLGGSKFPAATTTTTTKGRLHTCANLKNFIISWHLDFGDQLLTIGNHLIFISWSPINSINI